MVVHITSHCVHVLNVKNVHCIMVLFCCVFHCWSTMKVKFGVQTFWCRQKGLVPLYS